jgi:hypothetical protein
MPAAQAPIGRKILRRNGYGSYLGLNRRGQRVRTMPALDPFRNSTRSGRRSREWTLACCLSRAELRSRTFRPSLETFDELPEVPPRK